MKITSLLFAFTLLALSACNPDKPVVEEICGCTNNKAANFNIEANCDDGSCVFLDDEIRSLNTLFTSTGCGACGIYGIDCHKSYYTEMLADALPFELHFKYGDPMINETNDSFVLIAQPRYSPFFAVGLRESMIVGEDRPKTCELSSQNAKKLIEEFKSNTPKTQLGITHLIKNDSLTVHFAINTLGQQGISYAIYVLEDSLVYTQNAGWKNDIEGWVHNNVVRDAINSVFGRLITEQIKVGSVSIPLKSDWNAANLYTMIVLWRPANSAPVVINAERSH